MHRRLGVDRRWMSARGNRVVVNEAISRRVNRNRRRRGLGGGRVVVLKTGQSQLTRSARPASSTWRSSRTGCRHPTDPSGTDTASCPFGKGVVGVGFDIVNSISRGEVHVTSIVPSSNQVTVTADEDDTGTASQWGIKEYAVCSTEPFGLEIVSSPLPATGGFDAPQPAQPGRPRSVVGPWTRPDTTSTLWASRSAPIRVSSSHCLLER